MGILDKLSGSSPFQLIEEHTKKVHQCVELLRPLTKALLDGDYDKIDELHHEMSKTEHEADLIKNQIRDRLTKIILFSVRRDELKRFVSVQDDIADCAEDFSVILLLRKTTIPPELKEDFTAFVDQIIKVSEHLLGVAEELSRLAESAFAGDAVKRISESIEQIGEEEWKADKLQRKFSIHFYSMENEIDVLTIIFLDKYCRVLSEVANSAESAGKYLRQIINR